MKLTIISQNLQGLNDLVKVDAIRNYFRPLTLSVNIICVQEHKLRDDRLVALIDSI
jgi:exonuclease III